MWGGRFKKKIDPEFEKFSESYQWDKRLLPHDLEIDAAHVKALKKCGVLNASEALKLESAIRSMQSAYKKGDLKISQGEEDVHTAIHLALKQKVGAVADKLHTGRSRNDLVAQSSRLYCVKHTGAILGLLRQLQLEITLKAEKCADILVPGMTHMQNAQVVSQAHILMAYVEMLERAVGRFEGARIFCDTCVLGSGALAGVTFRLDQKMIARELGLSAVTRNSYDVSGDRDYLLNVLSSIYFTGIQLSRIAEDIMIGQTHGFAYVDVDQAFCTGSSMMPQKKNADFIELLRGACGVFASNFTGFASTLKALPTSYNRDLQWDKKYLFDSVETMESVLNMLAKVFKTIEYRRSRAQEMVKDESLYATDYADYLVTKGVPFKEAHDQVGSIVHFAEEAKKPLSKIGLDLLKKMAPKTDGDVYDLFDAKHSVRMKRTQGSTHPSEVAKQIIFWKKKLRG